MVVPLSFPIILFLLFHNFFLVVKVKAIFVLFAWLISLDFPFLKQGFTLLLAWGKGISGKFHQALNSMHSCATGNDNLGNSI